MEEWARKFRSLTIALIFSGALNIALVASLAFSMLKENSVPISFSSCITKTQSKESTNGQILSMMANLSFRELVATLTNRDPVEEGYAKRDLALAALVAFHHFNLEKALASPLMQKREMVLSDARTVDLFPSLDDDQFQAIIRYAYQEKWPLTAKGLFSLLKKTTDASLEQAFLTTNEFHAVQILFQKTGAAQQTSDLLRLICEGSWDLLEQFWQQQTEALDFSVDKRRSFLLGYLALGSETAAQMLLRTDFAFALKKLEDPQVLTLLGAVKGRSEESERFCKELLGSVRGDGVRQASALLLQAYGASMPAPAKAAEPKASLALHVVKEGESLWKIARQYKVDVKELVKMNELEKDRLLPGMTLRVPDQSRRSGADGSGKGGVK